MYEDNRGTISRIYIAGKSGVDPADELKSLEFTSGHIGDFIMGESNTTGKGEAYKKTLFFVRL